MLLVITCTCTFTCTLVDRWFHAVSQIGRLSTYRPARFGLSQRDQKGRQKCLMAGSRDEHAVMLMLLLLWVWIEATGGELDTGLRDRRLIT